MADTGIKATPPFGILLKQWRKQRGLSQLALAQQAETTARHLSFVETGRSRPGHDLILRIGNALGISLRDTNRLLGAAGLAPIYAASDLKNRNLSAYAGSLRRLLSAHDPFPGCLTDVTGKIHAANMAFHRLFPGFARLTTDEMIDVFYGSVGPKRIENWPEVGWSFADRWRKTAAQFDDPEINRLAQRVHDHVAHLPRSLMPSDNPVISLRFRIGKETASVFTAVTSFADPQDVSLEELRLELLFPANTASERLFRKYAAKKNGDV